MAIETPIIQVVAATVHLDTNSGALVENYRKWLQSLPDRPKVAHLLLHTVGATFPWPARIWLAESLASWAPDNPAALHEAGMALPLGDPRRVDLLDRTLDLMSDRPDLPGHLRDGVGREAFTSAVAVSPEAAGRFMDRHQDLHDVLRTDAPDDPPALRFFEGLPLHVRPYDVRTELALVLELLGHRVESLQIRATVRAEKGEEYGRAQLFRFLQDDFDTDAVPALLRYCHMAGEWSPGLYQNACERIGARAGFEFLPFPALKQVEWKTANLMANRLRSRMSDSRSPTWAHKRLWGRCRGHLPVLGDNLSESRSPLDVAIGRKDSDGDGVADEDEIRLLTRIELADTDGDGQPDGTDAMPQVPSRPGSLRSAATAALMRFVLAAEKSETAAEAGERPEAAPPHATSGRFQHTRYLVAEADLVADLDTTNTRWIVVEPGEEDLITSILGGFYWNYLSLVARVPKENGWVACWVGSGFDVCALVSPSEDDWSIRPFNVSRTSP
jgi:hypothetical protein